MKVEVGSAPKLGVLITILALGLVLWMSPATAGAQSPGAGGPLAQGAGYAGAQGSPEVRSLQRRLRALGERPGQIDGLFGPRTEAAVRRLQLRTERAADGIVGPATRAALRRAQPRPLRQGAGYNSSVGSPRVRHLQRQLRRGGHSPGPVDGRFGPKTEAAVRRLQNDRNLPATGIAGPRTLAAMDAPRRDARAADQPRASAPDRPPTGESRPAREPRPAAAPSEALADDGLPQAPIAIALVLLALAAIWMATRRMAPGEQLEEGSSAEAHPGVAGNNRGLAGHPGSGNGHSGNGGNGRSGNGAPHPPIGALLRKRGDVAPDAVERALIEQRREGGRLGEILVAQGAVDGEALRVALAEQMDLPSLVPDYEAVPALPYDIARRERATVLAGPTGCTEADGPVLVAVGDLDSVPAIASVLDRPVEPRLSDPVTLDALLAEAYKPSDAASDRPEAPGQADVDASKPAPAHTLLIPLRRVTVTGLEELSRQLELLEDESRVLEAIALVDVSDRSTRRALGRHPLPSWVTVELVPATTARSRAAMLIFGLEHARGQSFTVVHPGTPLPADLLRTQLTSEQRSPMQSFLSEALADPARRDQEPVRHRTSDVRVALGLAPLEVSETPALVQIDWSQDGSGGCFRLLSLDRRVGDPSHPRSPDVQLNANGDVPRTAAASRAHAMLYDRLVLTGWEPAGRGTPWYAHRFTRPPPKC